MRTGISFVLILLVVLVSCSSPTPTGSDSSVIDPSLEPAQEKAEDVPPIKIERSGWSFKLTPKASYSIAGEVLSRKNYHTGTNSLLAPCDVALVFGELYASGLYREIDWSQSGRWYWWRYGGDFPRQDDKYIARWSCNNHIIPATDNLKKAAKSVSGGDIVVPEGYLVSIDGSKDGETFWWRSSLTRSDTGDGSCEVLYLTRMRIGEDVFE